MRNPRQISQVSVDLRGVDDLNNKQEEEKRYVLQLMALYLRSLLSSGLVENPLNIA